MRHLKKARLYDFPVGGGLCAAPIGYYGHFIGMAHRPFPTLCILRLSYKGSLQAGAPGLAGGDGCRRGLFFPADAAAFRAGQAVPGLDAYKPGHTGLAPDQGIGEALQAAYHAPAGILFVKAQALGGKVYHAVAIVGEKLFVNGDRADITRQVVAFSVYQAPGRRFQAQGGFRGDQEPSQRGRASRCDRL